MGSIELARPARMLWQTGEHRPVTEWRGTP